MVKTIVKPIHAGLQWNDCVEPEWKRKCGDYNLAVMFPKKHHTFIENDRFGFDYAYGDKVDRIKKGIPVDHSGIPTADAHFPVHAFWIEEGANAEVPELVRAQYNNECRPMWHTKELEHTRPWHEHGKEITRHYDRNHNLVATNASYETTNDVLDAIRNDEFVPFP